MFDKIASNWALTRQKPWAPFADFLSHWFPQWIKRCSIKANTQNMLFLDIGAGSGRNSSIISQYCSRLLELDESREMLHQNPNKKMTLQAKMQFLPFRPDIFDGVCSIAAIHHIKGQITRDQCLDEFERVLKPRGLIVITVWRFFQAKFKKDFAEQLQRCPQPKQHEEIGDLFVKWTIEKEGSKEQIPRFYHLFRAGEFRKLIRRFIPIKCQATGSRGNRDNFFFIGESNQQHEK